jgi:hypothetical protein
LFISKLFNDAFATAEEICINYEKVRIWKEMAVARFKVTKSDNRPKNLGKVTNTTGRAIAQAVSRRLPTVAARLQTWVWSCGILWWTKVALGQVFSENFGFPTNLHSICFSTIIFTVTRGWHNRPGVAAAVPIASQTK